MSSRKYPPMRYRWRTLVGALLAALMVLTACGGTSSTTTTTTASTAASGSDESEAAEDASSETDDGPQSFEDIEFRSPIAEFFGQDFDFSGEDSEVEIVEMEREAERATAECMRALGFEYTPQNSSMSVSFGGPDGDVPYFSDEWVAKYGFGITTQRFPQSMVGDLVGFPDEDFGPMNEEFVDPNMEYMESLSDGERDAYQAALWGAPPDFGPEGPTEEQMADFQPSGCQNEAFESVFNGGGDMGAFYTEFGDQLDAMHDRVSADPAVVAYQNEVSSCVTEAGMEYTDMDDLYQRFESEMNSLQPGAFSQGDPFEAAGLDPEQMSEREIDEFFQELNRLDPQGLATLGALQAEELELAAVVSECGGGPLQEQAVMADVRVKYEQEFVDANADRMEEFRSDE